MTTDRARANRSTRASCVLQKLSADSLLVSRLSRQPPPMTTNRGHDRDSFFSNNFTYSARLHVTVTPEQDGQRRSVGRTLANTCILTATEIIESM